MGLLDDLLGQIGGAARPAADAPAAGAAGTGSNMNRTMVLLLPIVLELLRGRGTSPSAAGPRGGGGLGGMLRDMISGGGGGGGGGGGLGDLLGRFERAGFGDQVHSWVGRGQNMPIPPEALERVLGRDGVAEIARRAGLSEQDASHALSGLMPEMVDRMTPDGEVPDEASLNDRIDALAKRLGPE